MTTRADIPQITREDIPRVAELGQQVADLLESRTPEQIPSEAWKLIDRLVESSLALTEIIRSVLGAKYADYPLMRRQRESACRCDEPRTCQRCRMELEVLNGTGPDPKELDALHRRRVAEHNITVEEYRALIDQQDRRCAICRYEPIMAESLHIDHNHQTGKVRGLLCGGCNSGLGYFGDNPAYLEAAIGYLKTRGSYHMEDQ